MSEKTIEELRLELAALKKQNTEREIELERAKLVEAEELKKKENDKKLRDQIRDEVISELSTKSNISSKKPETLGSNSMIERFKADYIAYANNDLDFHKRTGRAAGAQMNVFRGKSYEEILKDLKNGIKRGR